MTRTITVKGTGSVSARPDYIILMFSISAKDPDYETAMKTASERIAALEAAALAAGFEKGALKTAGFSVNTQYETVKDDCGNFQSVFAGYSCSYRLKLAFDFDSGRLAAVLSAAAGSGAEPEVGISFTVKDPAKVNEALLASAAANGRAKAEILCRASGVELGQLVSIDYSWSERNIFSPTQYNLENSAMPMLAAKGRCAPEIQPDDIELHDTATFVWEIQNLYS